jgi:hypothetical protein
MKPQPILDKDARFCCNHKHFSGVMLALYIDNGGNLAGVTLQGSNVDLAEIFGLADYNDFDAAIDAELAKQRRDQRVELGEYLAMTA